MVQFVKQNLSNGRQVQQSFPFLLIYNSSGLVRFSSYSARTQARTGDLGNNSQGAVRTKTVVLDKPTWFLLSAIDVVFLLD